MSAKEQPGMAVTIFTGIGVRTHLAMADLKRFIYETGRPEAILQCADEDSDQAESRAAIKYIGGLTGRLTPTEASHSQ